MKRLEEVRHFVGRNADAVVGDAKADGVFGKICPHLQPDRAVFVGKLDGVAEEVDQYLFEPACIGLHPKIIRRANERHDLILAFRLGLHHMQGAEADIAHQHRFNIDLQPPSLQLGEIEHAVDQPQQMFAALLNQLD